MTSPGRGESDQMPIREERPPQTSVTITLQTVAREKDLPTFRGLESMILSVEDRLTTR